MAFIGDGIVTGDQVRDQVGYFGASSNYVPSNRSLLTPFEFYQDRGYGEGIKVIRSLVDIGRVRDGWLSHTFGDENLFWRIWFEPVEYAAGFITEERQFYIKVWNAFMDALATVSAINVSSQEGTSIDHSPVPILISKFGDTTAEVTIERVGPPLQNTVYTFTVNSDDYTCTITGMRVINWLLEPNWERGVKIELAFETSISQNRFFKEQRRYLREDFWRTLKTSSWAKGLDAQILKQNVVYGHDKFFGVPIYSEHCYPTGTITGETTINIENDMTKFWNLNNLCSYIIIVDHNKLVGEVKEVSSIEASSIELVRSVTQTFDAVSTIVYPMFIGILSSLSIRNKTDDVTFFDVAFEEYISG